MYLCGHNESFIVYFCFDTASLHDCSILFLIGHALYVIFLMGCLFIALCSKLMDRVITVEYAIRDDDRSNGHSPERRGRDLSPERGSYRRRSPSPYRRERGSPDYGYRRERGSPDYGRGSKSEARGSPDYGRDESPADARYHRFVLMSNLYHLHSFL